MDRLGIEFLSVFALPPVEYVNLAADLGCRHISMMLASPPINPEGYPAYSLLVDKPLRRELLAAMRTRGVEISLGEGFLVQPGSDARNQQAALELVRELGGRRINTISMDPDLQRSFDQFSLFTELAAALGMETTLELVPGLTVCDLPTALAAVRHVDRVEFGLLIDTMHLIRSGATPADLAALDPALIRYVQLSDVPIVPTIADYMQEGMCERLPPGGGELPLLDILTIVPRDLVVSLEVPQMAKALSGVGPYDRVRPCVEAARALLQQLPAA